MSEKTLEQLAQHYVEAVLGPVNGHGCNVHPITSEPSQIIMAEGYRRFTGPVFTDAIDQYALTLEGSDMFNWFGPSEIRLGGVTIWEGEPELRAALINSRGEAA